MNVQDMQTEGAPQAIPSDNGSRMSRWLPAFIFMSLALAIVFVASYALEDYKARIKGEIQTSLLATARYKVQQVEAWRTRLLRLGKHTSQDPLLARELKRWSTRGFPSDTQRQLIVERLKAMALAQGVQAVFWFDASGVIRLASHAAAPPPTAYGRQTALDALGGGEPRLTDLHFRDKRISTDIVIDLLVPTFHTLANGQRESTGVLYVRVDPYTSLYPLIRAQVGDKATEETFLARREGDRILYLSELGEVPDSALQYTLPAERRLLSAMVTEGQGKVLEGIDYRGIPSLGAGLKVPGTPWILVVKVSQDEVLAPIQERAVLTGGVVLLLLIAAGSVSTLTWKVQRARAAALERAKQAADAANRAKSAFLSAMSHEIRTPLNAILGVTHLCLQTDLTGKQRDYVVKVHRAGRMLLAIVNDILDFSKIEAGKLDLEETDFDLNDTLANIESMLGHTAREKGLDFRIEVGTGVPHYLRGDPLRLGQVLLNLVGNAVKFTDKGSVVIWVAASSATAESVEVEFSVRDTGIGLTPEQARQLFRPFSQADITTTRKYGGTGLGLAICKRLVELMGGHIWAESAPGQGSDFRFRVPLRRGLRLETHAIAPDSVREAAGQLRGTRVLLVEDNTFNQEVAVELLESVGATVTVAGNGLEALDCLAGATFDAVLMDVRMPQMDGCDATLRIRTMPALRRLPVIALTADATQEEEKHCLASGMDGLITKPIDPDRFYFTLAGLLRERADGESRSGITAGETASNTAADAAQCPGGAEAVHPVLDLAVLGRMVSGDPARVRRFAFKFIDTARETLAEMDAARARRDLASLAELAHKLKSSARTVGALAFADLCVGLEAAGKAADEARAGELHAQLHPLLDRVAQQIGHELPEPGTSSVGADLSGDKTT